MFGARSVVLLSIFLPSLSISLPVQAQTLDAALQAYVARAVDDATKYQDATIAEWAKAHPDEIVEAPDWSKFEYDGSGFEGESGPDAKIDGLWCLRSIRDTELADGVRVERIAIFYQPRVEDSYGKLLPPLPAETGDDLRRHECRLVKILHEFAGAGDPLALAGSIARLMPVPASDSLEGERDPALAYWRPLHSFEIPGRNGAHFKLEIGSKTHNAESSDRTVLLWSETKTLDYGEPSSHGIGSDADQPWIPMRAAMLAGEPAAPTLALLSLISTAPRGDPGERTPIVCDEKLVPALQKWMSLETDGPPEKRAAVLFFADQVLGYASSICAEFQEGLDPGFWSRKSTEDAEEVQNRMHDSLVQHLSELGIQTGQSARPANEFYAGNLMPEVLKLASPKGQVAELAKADKLSDRCHFGEDGGHSLPLIQEGESFLAGFHEDEFTSVVHLELAQEYSQAALDAVNGNSAAMADRDAYIKKAIAHFRAWFDASRNERDRALVWEEIWGLQAGLPPRLVPNTCPYE